jgi:hypothetical protein
MGGGGIIYLNIICTPALNVQVRFYLFLGASRWAGDEDITQEHAVGPAGPHLPLREHRLRQLHPNQIETGVINKQHGPEPTFQQGVYSRWQRNKRDLVARLIGTFW